MSTIDVIVYLLNVVESLIGRRMIQPIFVWPEVVLAILLDETLLNSIVILGSCTVFMTCVTKPLNFAK